MAVLELRGPRAPLRRRRRPGRDLVHRREGPDARLLGPNGAGKTTAMRIVLGVLAADRGEVSLDGRPVDFDLRSHFGYMPEERGLYPKLRVRDQLVHLAGLHGVPAAAARESADRWIERLG